MKRTNDDRIVTDGWEFRAERGLHVIAQRWSDPTTDEYVDAQLDIVRNAPTLLLRVVGYHHRLDGGDVTTSPPPLEQITAWANLPDNALALLDQRMVNPAAKGLMLLPQSNAVGKKPDRHYAMVLVYKQACEQAGIPYAERIARDNSVEPGTVYRWVQEADRRKITIGGDGQVRIDGTPMDVIVEPMDMGVEPKKVAP